MTVTTETECKDCGRAIVMEVPEAFIGFAPEMRCDDCGGRWETAEAERLAEESAERERKMIGARRASSGVPPHLQDFDFKQLLDDPTLEFAQEAARRWVSGVINGLVLGGPTGVGKTRISIAAANEIARTRAVHFLSGPLLLARLGTGGFDHPVRQATLDALLGTEALVLDDLDKARPTEYAAEILFLAIDQRADGAAPLLVTSNLDLDELSTRWPGEYGEALSSRLSLCETIVIPGKDRRRGLRSR